MSCFDLGDGKLFIQKALFSIGTFNLSEWICSVEQMTTLYANMEKTVLA